MKKSMTNYLYALSENNCDILFEIISNKYRKFIRLYWLLKEYSDNIIGLKYSEKTNNEILKISVMFSGLEPDVVADSLHSYESDEVLIDVKNKKLFIEIHQTEVDA